MAEDSNLSTNQGRVAAEQKIDEVLAKWSLALSAENALSILDGADVPAGPVNSIADIAADPHFHARGAFEEVNVNNQSRRMPTVHPRLSHTPATTRWAGPELGQHTADVLADWLEASDQQIAQWRDRQLI